MKKNVMYYLLIILFFTSVILSIIIIFSREEKQFIKHHLFHKTVPLSIQKLPKIALVEIIGGIYYEDSSKRFLTRDARYIVDRLKFFSKQKDINGIILRINSPGGSVGAVQQIYSLVMKIRKEYKKPVVCFVPEICVSGGYYIASGCDKIITSPGAIVGSIGVLLQTPNLSGLIKKIGIDMVVIKSSKYKDIGSMFREMSVEEKKILEDLVNSAYEQFITAVSEGRNLSKEQVLTFSDGRIFIAEQAKKLSMIDEIGDEDKAVEILKDLCGIKGEVRIVKDVHPLDFLKSIAGETRTNFVEKVINKNFRFEYIFE